MHTLEFGMRCFEPSYDYKVSELLVFIRAAAGITPLSRGGAFEERSRFHDIVLEGIDLVLTLSRTSGRKQRRLCRTVIVCGCVFDVRYAPYSDHWREVADVPIATLGFSGSPR